MIEEGSSQCVKLLLLDFYTRSLPLQEPTASLETIFLVSFPCEGKINYPHPNTLMCQVCNQTLNSILLTLGVKVR